MQCYNHHDKAAVATCKACGKGVCPDCAHESAAGISCESDACAERTEQMALVIRTSAQAIARQSAWRSPLILIAIVAAIYIAVMNAILMMGADKVGVPLMALMSVGLISIGLIGVATALKVKRTAPNSRTKG